MASATVLRSKSPESLAELLNDYLSKGWKRNGSVSKDGDSFVQFMELPDGTKGISLQEFGEFCVKHAKRDHETSEELILSAAGELCEEAGEVMGLVKKKCYYGVGPLTSEIASELGDTLFAICNVSAIIGVDLQLVMGATMQKIREAYPNGFEQKDAARRFKQGR